MNKLTYIILRSPSLEELQAKVCAAMADGYVPAGGVLASCVNTFAQAVMLREPPRSHHKKKDA